MFQRIRSPNASIGIIGSSLTAFDTVLALIDHGHSGPIYLMSRTGVLPSVLAREVPNLELKYFTRDNLEEKMVDGRLKFEAVLELFQAEVEYHMNQSVGRQF